MTKQEFRNEVADIANYGICLGDKCTDRHLDDIASHDKQLGQMLRSAVTSLREAHAYCQERLES